MKHLKYEYITAAECGKPGHAQEVMKELGITYQTSTPQSTLDQFWFWNCKGIPELLKYITELELYPMDCLGWGLLSRKEAESIRDYEN
tara:strand:+ start:26052 stop:26315 length:264 start_codon:yes stop_codon:yes gene_type:complete